MTIETRTVVDQREVIANGIIQIRFRKELVEDGKVLTSEYHRTSLQPGDDLDRQMNAVNAHLKQMGCAVVDADGIESIRRIVDAEHTPERIAAFKAQI